MSLANPSQSPINFGLAPQQAMGARQIGPILIPFQSAVGGQFIIMTYADDLTVEGQEGMIDNIQSIFFDNMANFFDVYFTMLDTGQVLCLPAKTQGYLPILCANSIRYQAQIGYSEAQQSTPFIKVSFFNTPVQPCIWGPREIGQTTGYLASASNAGNAVTGTSLTNGSSIQQNKNIYVTRISYDGDCPTVGTNVTMTLTNMINGNTGAIGNLTWQFGAPAGPGIIHWEKTFPQPLRAATTPLSGAHPPGFQSLLPVLSAPAVGAGQTWSSCDANWFVI